MTDQEKREKVVSDLAILRTWVAVNPDYGVGLSVEDCRKAVKWLDETLELLKAQEPREVDLDQFKECIKNATIKKIREFDAVPVVHGRWLERHMVHDAHLIDEWQSALCSRCGKYHTTPYLYYFENYKYCPNCGAKMDGRDDDDAE